MHEIIFPLKTTLLEIRNTTNSPTMGGLFGYTRSNGQKIHTGVDLKADRNTEVDAIQDGIVVFAGTTPGYGNVVYLNHNNGTQTRYAHLATIDVQTGNKLQAGDKLGTVGSSGNAAEHDPHLHFELRKLTNLEHTTSNNASIAVDPLPLLKQSYEQSHYVAPEANLKNQWGKFSCINN